MVPEGTLGGEAKLAKGLTLLGDVGVGNEVLRASNYNENTGYASVGIRAYDSRGGFATLAMVTPTNKVFLDSPWLGIPFIRVGGDF